MVDIDTVSDSTQLSTTSTEQPSQSKLVITREHVEPETDGVKIENPFSDEQVHDFAEHVKLVREKGDALNIRLITKGKVVGRTMIAACTLLPPAFIAAEKDTAGLATGLLTVVVGAATFIGHSTVSVPRAAKRMGLHAQRSLGESYELLRMPSAEGPEASKILMHYYGNRRDTPLNWTMSPLERVRRMATLAEANGVDEMVIDEELAKSLAVPEEETRIPVTKLLERRGLASVNAFVHSVVARTPGGWLELTEQNITESLMEKTKKEYALSDLIKMLAAVSPDHPIVGVYNAHQKEQASQEAMNPAEKSAHMMRQAEATLRSVNLAIDREFSTLGSTRASAFQQANYGMGPEKTASQATAVITASSPRLVRWNPPKKNETEGTFDAYWNTDISDGTLRIGYRNPNGQITGNMLVEELLGMSQADIQARIQALEIGVGSKKDVNISDDPTRDIRLLIALLAQQLRTGENSAGKREILIGKETSKKPSRLFDPFSLSGGARTQETLLQTSLPEDSKAPHYKADSLHKSLSHLMKENHAKSTKILVGLVLGSALLSGGLELNLMDEQAYARAQIAYEQGIDPGAITAEDIDKRIKGNSVLAYSWSLAGDALDSAARFVNDKGDSRTKTQTPQLDSSNPVMGTGNVGDRNKQPAQTYWTVKPTNMSAAGLWAVSTSTTLSTKDNGLSWIRRDVNEGFAQGSMLPKGFGDELSAPNTKAFRQITEYDYDASGNLRIPVLNGTKVEAGHVGDIGVYARQLTMERLRLNPRVTIGRQVIWSIG